MLLTTFIGCNTAYDIGTVCDTLLGMESSLFSVNPCTITFVSLFTKIDIFSPYAFAAASTAFFAPSARSLAASTLSIFALRKISAASGALVPSSLTITEHSRLPFLLLLKYRLQYGHISLFRRKYFTNIAFTFGFFKMISKPFATVSAFAFPPTSRKFAGFRPYN